MAREEDDVVNKTQDAAANLMKKKMTRRRALSTAGKVGVAVVGTAVVAGAAGYYGGILGAPKASTATATETVTSTVTSSAPSTTTSSASSTTTSSASSTTSPFASYPSYVATWPLDMSVDNPPSGLKGSVKSVMATSIVYQTDCTTPGTRAYTVLAALKHTYPNVTWTNFDPGSSPIAVTNVMTSHQYVWDVARGVGGSANPPGPADMPLNHLVPFTDYFNAWEDKDQMPPGDMAIFSYKDEVYGVPDTGEVHAGWWRKDLFAKAGYGTFDPKTYEYTGTTPNEMNYSELLQAITKITQQGSSNHIYGTYWPNATTAIIGPWVTDNMLRANGAQRYHGDSTSCTIDLGNAPYLNKALDTLTFMQQVFPYETPGAPTLDINALITTLLGGQVGFMFGLDQNLDGEYAAVPLSTVNPTSGANATATLRNAIQPSVGFADGTPLNPNIPPAIKFPGMYAMLYGTTNLAANWEWIRAMASFNSELSLVGNGAGSPERLDVQALVAADPHADLAEWIIALKGNSYVDVPLAAGYGSLLTTAYVNSFDAFLAGSGTPEQCIESFVNGATAALQKAGIPEATS